jgi:hypothetical protein
MGSPWRNACCVWAGCSWENLLQRLWPEMLYMFLINQYQPCQIRLPSRALLNCSLTSPDWGSALHDCHDWLQPAHVSAAVIRICSILRIETLQGLSGLWGMCSSVACCCEMMPSEIHISSRPFVFDCLDAALPRALQIHQLVINCIKF